MTENREPAFWPWFISLGACCVVVGYFVAQADHVTAISVIALVLSSLTGYCLMASRLLCLSCALGAAGLLTSILGMFCRPTLAAWLGTSGFALIVIITGVVVVLATTVALRRLVVKFCSARPSLEPINRWAGFGIGAAQGAILCMLALGGLLVLEPIAQHRLASDVEVRDHKIARVLAARVSEYAAQTRNSTIGPMVARYNLFQHLSTIDELSGGLRDLRIPLTGPSSQSERAIEEHFSAR